MKNTKEFRDFAIHLSKINKINDVDLLITKAEKFSENKNVKLDLFCLSCTSTLMRELLISDLYLLIESDSYDMRFKEMRDLNIDTTLYESAILKMKRFAEKHALNCFEWSNVSVTCIDYEIIKLMLIIE